MARGYVRPNVEIETTMNSEWKDDGDQIIDVVIRFCNFRSENGKLSLSVTAQRLPFKEGDSRNRGNDPYNTGWDYLESRETTFPNYAEYHFSILGRAHSGETGIIQIMLSAAGTLADARLHFDTRLEQPYIEKQEGFPTYGFRILPMRTQAERDALKGKFLPPDTAFGQNSLLGVTPAQSSDEDPEPATGPFKHILFDDMMLTASINLDILYRLLELPKSDFSLPEKKNGQGKYELSFTTPERLSEDRQQLIKTHLTLSDDECSFNNPVEIAAEK